MASNHQKAWKYLEEKLKDIAEERTNCSEPIIALLAAVIVSGGKDRDLDYIHKGGFLYQCYVLHLNSDVVFRYFKHFWRCIDDNLPIVLTDPLPENSYYGDGYIT